MPNSSELYSVIEISGENDLDSTIDITQNQGKNNTDIFYIDDCDINMRPNKECKFVLV